MLLQTHLKTTDTHTHIYIYKYMFYMYIYSYCLGALNLWMNSLKCEPPLTTNKKKCISDTSLCIASLWSQWVVGSILCLQRNKGMLLEKQLRESGVSWHHGGKIVVSMTLLFGNSWNSSSEPSPHYRIEGFKEDTLIGLP